MITIKAKSSVPGYRTIILIILLFVTFFSYFQITGYDFLQWDDDAQITQNVYVTNMDWHSIRHNFLHERFTFITLTVYSVLYQLWGNNPAPFHWLSIILHLINLILLSALIKRFSDTIYTVALVLILFALHPMRVESVAWISEIKDLLFTMFSLLAFTFYFGYVKNNFKYYYFILTALMTILASFSKIQGIIVPFSLVLIDIFCHRKLSIDLILEKIVLLYIVFFFFFFLGIKVLILSTALVTIYLLLKKRISDVKKSVSSIIISLTGLAGLVFLIYGFTHYELWLWDNMAGSQKPYFFSERLLFAGYALWFYIKSFFFPFPMNAVHPYPVRLPGGDLPSVYYVTLIVLALTIIVTVLLIVKRKKIPDLFFFGWFFFLTNISIVLHLIPIEGRLIVADRYSYLAYLGLFFCVASAGEHYLFQRQKLKKVLIVCFVLLMGTLSFTTYKRCQVWENTDTLFTDVLQKNPSVSFAYCNLAASYMSHQQADSAIICFNKALALDPEDPGAYFNRAFAFMAQKNDGDALKDFNSFLRLNKDKKLKSLAYTHIGEIYGDRGADSVAIFYFNLAIQTDSSLANAYNSRGIYFLNKKNLANARRDFRKAIELNSYQADSYNNLGLTLMAEGKLKEAQKCFTDAIELNPDYSLAYDNRGYVKYMNGDAAGAVKDFNKVLTINPAMIQTYIKRGRAYAQLRDYNSAIRDFSYVLSKEPGNMNALTNRGYAYFYNNEAGKAGNDFVLNTQLYPQNALVWQNLAWFHMQMKNYKNAADAYEKSIELDQTLIISYINAGWIYMEFKEYEKAEKFFKIAQNRDPGNSEPLFLLGELKRKKGDYLISCEYYLKASQLGNNQAKNALNQYCKSSNQAITLN
ncbi:MAG TPA: tetratricopeptide repeat protein [Bacteroidales bacterium]|nr:tetratricopeptide repeat protein [Bacteroidales bacterium]